MAPKGITTAAEIKAASTADILVRFNELNKYVYGDTVMDVKRFSNRESAEKRLVQILAEAAKKDAPPKASKKAETAAPAEAAVDPKAEAKAAKAAEKAAAAKAKEEAKAKVAQEKAAAKAEKQAAKEAAKGEPKPRKQREGALNEATNPVIYLLDNPAYQERAHEASRRTAVFAQIGDSDAKFKVKTPEGETKTVKGIRYNDLQKQFPEYDVRPYISKMVVTERALVCYDFKEA